MQIPIPEWRLSIGMRNPTSNRAQEKKLLLLYTGYGEKKN